MQITNYKHSDLLHLAVIRNGTQKNYILHKTLACLVLDAGWLLNPDGPSQAGDYLAKQQPVESPIAPLGYGCVLVSFDDKTVYSYQVYKDIRHFLLDDVGYYGASSPSWMDWPRVIDDAFTSGCINRIIYHNEGDGGDIAVNIPLSVRERKTRTLRFATRQKPAGYVTAGIGFNPPGWCVRHENVPEKLTLRETVTARVRKNLQHLRAAMAPDPVWDEFVGAR